MSWQDCLLLVSTVRLTGTASAVSEPTVTLQLPVCGHSKLDHSVCEIPVLITTDCGEKEVNALAFSVVSIFLLADPLCLILAFSVFGHAFFKKKKILAKHLKFYSFYKRNTTTEKTQSLGYIP